MFFGMTFGFISCKAEVEESAPTPEPQSTYYTVTYSSEHGTVPVAISVEENTILTESQLPVLSDGVLVFKGWYANGVKVVTGEYRITGNVTLTAQWDTTATVSYHSKFGTVPQSFERDLNQTLTADNLNAMTFSPYTFLGWYYEKDADDNGTGTQAHTGDAITADVPLYAKWQTATVSFTSAHGTVPSIKKYTGQKLADSEIPSLTSAGYSFDGWFNGTTKLTTGYTVTDDIAFTAKWTANNYTITFKANGGTGADYTQTVTYGTTPKLNANIFSKDGYVFDGWNSSADGSGSAFADKSYFAVTEANGIVLYAQWDPIADATTIVSMIQNMTESGTIAAKGTFSNELIRQINSALKTLSTDVLVFLDLSNVTGLTELEDSSDFSNISFNGCYNLSGIILPNSVTSIGEYAFYRCERLISITIPNSVTSIGKSAIQECRSLTSITIPNSVTSIGDQAFYSCSSLTSITIPSSVTSIGDKAFSYCDSLASITIPNSVTSIGDNAFELCPSLTSITIPNSVTSIGDHVFESCRSLASVTIPNSVTSIGENAFLDCTNLVSITIPNSVTSIGNCAFRFCPITSIDIPNSVTSIGVGAFGYCTSLTSINIPNSVTSIGEEAFAGCSKLTSITIPNSVTSIGDYAFELCPSLTSITIPNSVTSIGVGAFYKCTSLTGITIPNSVTSIGVGAFKGCSSLASITIPNSVTSIGATAFDGCTSLVSITFSDTSSKWYRTNSYNYTNGTEIGPMSSDASANATLLKTTYKDYFLYKK